MAWRIAAAAGCLLAAGVLWAYITAPTRNNDDPQVDALLVLGSPTGDGGALTEMQRWRVDEAVREYRRGRARHILITGGATLYGYLESVTMARYAQRLGVPRTALLEEVRATTTVENVRYSQQILDAHGWRRVEVISTPEHLPRAAVILQHSHLLWQTHAAPTPGRSRMRTAGAYVEEAVGTAAIRVFGLRAEPVLHRMAEMQHRVLLGMKPARHR